MVGLREILFVNKSNNIEPTHTNINHTKSSEVKVYPINPKQSSYITYNNIKTMRTDPYQVRPHQLKPNQFKSNGIKQNQFKSTPGSGARWVWTAAADIVDLVVATVVARPPQDFLRSDLLVVVD